MRDEVLVVRPSSALLTLQPFDVLRMHDKRVVDAMLGARKLETHRDLFNWLRSDVHLLLPHDILVAAWGDFSSRRISLDVVSPLPGVRTTEPVCTSLQQMLVCVFEAWIDAGRSPFAKPLSDCLQPAHAVGKIEAAGEMRSVVAHGIRDERGQIDCLYVALSRDYGVSQNSVEAMGMLLPYIDAAFRRVSLLPMQRENALIVLSENEVLPLSDANLEIVQGDVRLSNREQEIMQWVSVGKTNVEIGQILGISPRTVRNHLQNIFRKLDVMNRAQAVYEVEQLRGVERRID